MSDILKLIGKLKFIRDHECKTTAEVEAMNDVITELSAQPEIIRCKDCKWWGKYSDYDNGYCMAVKHGYWDEHWDISIRRTYDADWYCADAERR